MEKLKPCRHKWRIDCWLHNTWFKGKVLERNVFSVTAQCAHDCGEQMTVEQIEKALNSLPRRPKAKSKKVKR